MAQRYGDSPIGVLLWPPAWLYIGTNVVASVAALAIVRTLDWTFGFGQASPTARATVQVVVAGAGAMALFRSRLFTGAQRASAAGEVKFLWSPASVLEGILKIADREARKTQGGNRLRAARAVRAITWQQAKSCLQLCYPSWLATPTKQPTRLGRPNSPVTSKRLYATKRGERPRTCAVR
jgi:hypothetical protein